MLTFEMVDSEVLELHGDREGLLHLAKILTYLAQCKEPDHAHLMTPDWGGPGLSADPQNPDSSLFKHVKVLVWPDEVK